MLVVEDEVAREGRVVVEQSGVFAKLNPDEVICLHRQYQCLAARSVTSSTVAVYWHLYNQRYLPQSATGPNCMSQLLG